MKYQVKLVQTARGNYPVKDFIHKQNKQTIAKVLHTIELLEEFGPNLRMPYSKKIASNLYELRVSGKEAVRVLYSNIKGIFYLLHAFKKKARKTPKKEIEIALDRLRDLV